MMIEFLYNRLNSQKQKDFVVKAINDILESKDNTIDQLTAIKIIESVTKSKGNTITAFILKDK